MYIYMHLISRTPGEKFLGINNHNTKEVRGAHVRVCFTPYTSFFCYFLRKSCRSPYMVWNKPLHVRLSPAFSYDLLPIFFCIFIFAVHANGVMCRWPIISPASVTWHPLMPAMLWAWGQLVQQFFVLSWPCLAKLWWYHVESPTVPVLGYVWYVPA